MYKKQNINTTIRLPPNRTKNFFRRCTRITLYINKNLTKINAYEIKITLRNNTTNDIITQCHLYTEVKITEYSIKS